MKTTLVSHAQSLGESGVEAVFDDAGLIERLKAGDGWAFEELVREAGGRMMAVARRMLGNEDDAADAVQEAFLGAYRAIGSFDGRSRLTTWLHRITVNACLMKMRTRRRKPEQAIEDLLPRFAEDGHQRTPSKSWKPPGEDGIESREMLGVVRAMIDQLPETYREVLMLRDIEELDTAAAAEVLGLSEAAVKTRLHRARQALRTLLDPYFSEER